LKIPPDFSKSASTSVGKKVSEHGRIEFAAFLGDAFGNCADRPNNLTVARIGMCTIRR
jgi:hypothetical protein